MGRYVKKTTRRRREDRNLSVRAEHRDPPDMDKLCQLLIRFTLQDMGESRARQRREEIAGTRKVQAGGTKGA
jgi:hypothetical protein